MIRRLVAIVGLVSIAAALNACAQKPAPEQSCNFVQNGDQQRVSWGGSVPVNVYIDDSVEARFYPDIMAAAKQWNEKIGHEVLRIALANSVGRPAQDGANIIYQMSSWEYDRRNEQARTTVYWAGDRIREADIRINNAYFSFSTSDLLIANRVDMQSLMVHELGHVLGLAHTNVAGSVMAKTLPSATPRRELSATDLKSIRCEY
jgi:hypothetical protein